MWETVSEIQLGEGSGSDTTSVSAQHSGACLTTAMTRDNSDVVKDNNIEKKWNDAMCSDIFLLFMEPT